MNTACAGERYASPPKEGLALLSLNLTVRISPVFVGPVRICALLDGERLTTSDDAKGVASRLALGETVSIAAGVTASVRHELVLVVELDGGAGIRGYHFRLQSKHAFVLDGPGPGSVGAFVHEQAVVPIEQRPTITWNQSGAIAEAK